MIGLAQVAGVLCRDHGWDPNAPVQRHAAALQALAEESGVHVVPTEWGDQVSELDGFRLVAAVQAKEQVVRLAAAAAPSAPALPSDSLPASALAELGITSAAALTRTGVASLTDLQRLKHEQDDRDRVSALTGVAYREPALPQPPPAPAQRIQRVPPPWSNLFDPEIIWC